MHGVAFLGRLDTIRSEIKRIAFKKIARYDVAVTMMMIITVPIDSCLVWLLQ